MLQCLSLSDPRGHNGVQLSSESMHFIFPLFFLGFVHDLHQYLPISSVLICNVLHTGTYCVETLLSIRTNKCKFYIFKTLKQHILLVVLAPWNQICKLLLRVNIVREWSTYSINTTFRGVNFWCRGFPLKMERYERFSYSRKYCNYWIKKKLYFRKKSIEMYIVFNLSKG